MGKNLIQQARGKGSMRYRVPSFRYFGEAKMLAHTDKVLNGTVIDIVDCPGHLAPLAKIKYDDGREFLVQAAEGIRIGESVGYGSSIKTGSILKLNDIPEGTVIFNIEAIPGDGGKYCRTSGVFAKVISKMGGTVTVLLPSKKEKVFSKNCRAIIGVVSGGGRVEKPILKAGKMHFLKKARNKRYPNPSGAAQNAVDHPFGNKRTSRKAKQRPVNRFAPPGRKVGKISPRRTGRKK